MTIDRSPRRAAIAAALLAFPVVLTQPAQAQTAAGGRPPAPPAPPAPAMPVPDSVVQQAKRQAEGNFGPLVRPRTSGQVQETWDDADPTEAVYVTDLCDDCTYKVRTREYMVTVIELPRGEVIEAVDVGDDTGFSVSARGDRRLAVRPAGHGYDTSLLVYGKSGEVYPFYLRAEGFNSGNIPDLVVKLAGSVDIDGDLAVDGFDGVSDDKGRKELPPLEAPEAAAPGDAGPDAVTDLDAPDDAGGDFVQEIAFDPDALHGWGEYNLWGSDDTLQPETVFRDSRFTYVKFGDRWDDVELPTAYVVVDGIDELVNTRVAGRTFIIESTRPLITLKSGQSYLCIEYEGDDA